MTLRGYKAVDDLIGKEEKNLVRINSEQIRASNNIPDVSRGLDPDVGRAWDDVLYADYHMAKNADLSNEVIKFEQSLSAIDTLAKVNPAKLIRILDEMIEEANTNINRVRKGIDQGEGTLVCCKTGTYNLKILKLICSQPTRETYRLI